MKKKTDIVDSYYKEFLSKDSYINEKGNWEEFKHFSKNKKFIRQKYFLRTLVLSVVLVTSVMYYLNSNSKSSGNNTPINNTYIDSTELTTFTATPSIDKTNADTFQNSAKNKIKTSKATPFPNKNPIFIDTLSSTFANSDSTVSQHSHEIDIDTSGPTLKSTDTTALVVNKKTIVVKKKTIIRKKITSKPKPEEQD